MLKLTTNRNSRPSDDKSRQKKVSVTFKEDDDVKRISHVERFRHSERRSTINQISHLLLDDRPTLQHVSFVRVDTVNISISNKRKAWHKPSRTQEDSFIGVHYTLPQIVEDKTEKTGFRGYKDIGCGRPSCSNAMHIFFEEWKRRIKMDKPEKQKNLEDQVKELDSMIASEGLLDHTDEINRPTTTKKHGRRHSLSLYETLMKGESDSPPIQTGKRKQTSAPTTDTNIKQKKDKTATPKTIHFKVEDKNQSSKVRVESKEHKRQSCPGLKAEKNKQTPVVGRPGTGSNKQDPSSQIECHSSPKNSISSSNSFSSKESFHSIDDMPDVLFKHLMEQHSREKNRNQNADSVDDDDALNNFSRLSLQNEMDYQIGLPELRKRLIHDLKITNEEISRLKAENTELKNAKENQTHRHDNLPQLSHPTINQQAIPTPPQLIIYILSCIFGLVIAKLFL